MKKKKTDKLNKLIDCDVLMGAPRVPDSGITPDKKDLLSEMKRLSIDRAIVRHRSALECDPETANQILMQEVEGTKGLIPAWFVTPGGVGPDFNPELMVNNMLGMDIKICWTDPQHADFIFQPWCCKKLFNALCEHNIPLMISYQKINLSDLHQVMTGFPKLKIILLHLLRIGRIHMIETLMESHGNLHICLGSAFTVHAGYKSLCGKFGPHRWVWGTGYPDREGGASITALTYAGLRDRQISAIAGENIERLLCEVKK